MHQTLEQFAAQCHDALKAQPGPAGRQQVAALLQDVLNDQDFVDTYVNERVGERHILYEDPELGFCILAHNYLDAKTSGAHDHAHSWAIYGQARGETEMRDYQLVEPASADKPGKVRYTRTYKLTPGVAHVYNEGDLHSPKREGPTSLIRIEGTNMAKVKRFSYEQV
jgi:hypothetical protein